jgi:uncharacterized ferritin-like protein (DUF455 family)
VLEKIGREEEPHVAAGVRWFKHVCAVRGTDPVATYQELVRTRFKGTLKPPFNAEARGRAGMAPEYYESLA